MCKPFLCLVSSLFLYFHLSAKDYKLFSPDKRVQITVSVTDKVTWSIQYDLNVLTQPGELALTFDNGLSLGKNPLVTQEKRTSNDGTIVAINPVKSRLVRDQYNDLLLSFKGDYKVRFRAYNEGAAYRFETTLKDAEVSDVLNYVRNSFGNKGKAVTPDDVKAARKK